MVTTVCYGKRDCHGPAQVSSPFLWDSLKLEPSQEISLHSAEQVVETYDQGGLHRVCDIPLSCNCGWLDPALSGADGLPDT